MLTINGSLAEWSKALVLGTSLLCRRRFESHNCQIFKYYLIYYNIYIIILEYIL